MFECTPPPPGNCVYVTLKRSNHRQWLMDLGQAEINAFCSTAVDCADRWWIADKQMVTAQLFPYTIYRRLLVVFSFDVSFTQQQDLCLSEWWKSNPLVHYNVFIWIIKSISLEISARWSLFINNAHNALWWTKASRIGQSVVNYKYIQECRRHMLNEYAYSI